MNPVFYAATPGIFRSPSIVNHGLTIGSSSNFYGHSGHSPTALTLGDLGSLSFSKIKALRREGGGWEVQYGIYRGSPHKILGSYTRTLRILGRLPPVYSDRQNNNGGGRSTQPKAHAR